MVGGDVRPVVNGLTEAKAFFGIDSNIITTELGLVRYIAHSF